MKRIVYDEQELKYTPISTESSGSTFGGEPIEQEYVQMKFIKYTIDEIRRKLQDIELYLQERLGERLMQEFWLNIVRDGGYLEERFEINDSKLTKWLEAQPDASEIEAMVNDYLLGAFLEYEYPYREELTERNAPVVWVRRK